MSNITIRDGPRRICVSRSKHECLFGERKVCNGMQESFKSFRDAVTKRQIRIRWNSKDKNVFSYFKGERI